MSAAVIPASLRLRGLQNSLVQTSRDVAPRSLGILAGACLVSAAGLGVSHAQQSAQPELPALTVEAKKEVQPRRPVERKRVARPTPRRTIVAAPVQGQAEPSEQGANASAASGASPGVSPYGAAATPYKVDRLGNNKVSLPLLDAPRSVTAISKEVIEDKNATSFRELVRTTPGVTLGTGEGGNAFGDRIFIRGFDSRNDVYIDGVRDPGVNIRENFATEQVEILKGPNSTVGGRGNAGGAVNVVTKKPLFVDFHEVQSTLGTDRTRRITADINRVITPEFAVRANVMWQKADVAGRDFVFDDRWGGAIAATWKPSDSFSLTLDYFHLDLDQLPDWGVPFDIATKKPFTESGLRRDNYYGIPARDFQKAKQDIWTATAEWKFSDWAVLTNKLRYGRSMLDYVVGAPGTPNRTNPDPSLWTVNSTAKSRYQTTDVLTNQTDLTSKFTAFGATHTLITGVELSSEKTSRDTYRSLNTETNVSGPIPGITLNLWDPRSELVPWTSKLELVGRPTPVDIETRSAYVLDTMNFNEKFFVTGGVRVDDYRVSTLTYGAAPTYTTTGLERHDTMFNWNVGATYKVLPWWAIYAAYGTSSNPVGADVDGGGNDYGGLAASNAAAGPEKNTAAEVGTKMELFDKRLLVTASLFQTTKDNARETIGAGAAAVVVGSGEYVVRGVDVGVSGKITDRWSIFGGAVWMDSEVTRSSNTANIGKKLANIAHGSFNLLSKYDVTEKLTIGGQATWKSKIFGGTLAANENELPSGWRFDAFAEYKFTPNIVGKVMVVNIFDEVLYDAFYRSGAPYVYLAPGRAAYASLNYKW
ncbi:MAG: TonB-dependent siderophore receptor [Beijerinckiaceae bacterium]|nr:TonB-dependent siderophore receptor [Beijerinckiaceae bacterium]